MRRSLLSFHVSVLFRRQLLADLHCPQNQPTDQREDKQNAIKCQQTLSLTKNRNILM